MAETTQILYSHKEITTLLIKEKNLHEGLYDIALEFQIMVGSVGPTPETIMPGAVLGVSRIGITKVLQTGINTVDAAKVNPPPPSKPPKKLPKAT